MPYPNGATKSFTAQPRFKGGVGVRTLTGAVTCDNTTETFAFWDPGGSSRDITLPPEETSDGLFMFFKNTADAAENLVLKDDAAATIVTINQSEWAILACNGSAWYSIPLSGFADILASANTWALLQTLTVGALIADTGVLRFGTPGTDLVLTADGTDVVVTGTGDLVLVDNVDFYMGTGKDIGWKWDGTDLIVSQAAPDSTIKWGVSGAGINHVFYGDTATRDMSWDQTNDQCLFADNAKLGLGSGAGAAADIQVYWDGTRLNVIQLTPDSAIRWGVDGAGIDQVYFGDTAGAAMSWDQSQDARIMAGVAVDMHQQAGGAGGVLMSVIGPDLTHGEQRFVFEATVSPAAIGTALLTLPANSVVDSVQANVESALTGGGTTATWSIGINGDVDKFGTAFSGGAQADLLTKNSKTNFIGTKSNAGAGIGVYNPATVAVELFGAAAGGASVGDTALTVGSVKVRIIYRVIAAIADAP